MKRRLLSVILLLFLLAGCAADGAPQPTTNPAPETGLPQTFPGLGGTMPGMTFHTAQGETLTLSALLEEKELVVLNYWFQDCPWCLVEFPIMEVAYQQYRQDVEIVALNPVDGAQSIKAFQDKKSLSFPMAACPRSWAVEAGVSGYPTSIFIDRDGVVCLIHPGAITTTNAWHTLFEAFTGDDYERKIYNSINDLMR